MRSRARRRATLELNGVAVDVIATAPLDDSAAGDELDELFVRAHRFALDSVELVRVVVDTPERVEATLPLATAAGLVATKLCGVQGRRRPAEKQATDAYDLYRLLDGLDAEGSVAAAVVAGGAPVCGSVRRAAEEVLCRRAAAVVRTIRAYGADALSEVTVERLTFVGERFLDRLGTEA